MTSPYIIENKVNNVSPGVLKLWDFQNRHIPKNENPINTGTMLTSVENITGIAARIALGAL